MFCLLCHEKISRLRAWRTKSEFCCDEHAEIYKRQTLERLLTDHENTKPGEAPPLPVDTSQPDKSPVRAEERSSVAETLARFAEQGAATTSPARPDAAAALDQNTDRDEGLQELWRLAEEVSPVSGEADDEGWAGAAGELSGTSSELKPAGSRGLGGGLSSSLGSLGKGLGGGAGSVQEQSPEEALAALRELSSGSRRSPGGLEQPQDELDTLFSSRGFETTTSPESQQAGDTLPAAFDDALAGEDLPLLDAASLEPLDDDELPSILDRLTEQVSESEGFDVAANVAGEEFPEEPAPIPVAEEIHAGLNAPLVSEGAEEEPAAEAVEEVSLGEAPSEDLGPLDLLEAAVESRLEEPGERTAPRAPSYKDKVVPFPLPRPKPVSRQESEEPSPAASPTAASASGELNKSAKPGKPAKAAKGMPADLSRLQMKPASVMYGLEPVLHELAGTENAWSDLAARPGHNGFVEPPIHYPDARGGPRVGKNSRLPVYARLFQLLPETPEWQAAGSETGRVEGPAYQVTCQTPLPLALRRNGDSQRPSVGSERAWMCRIEPALAEGPDLELHLPNGKRLASGQALQLPPALVSGMTRQNGSRKLDLSGPQGRFEPPVDRLCVVFPELGELGACIPRQQPSKASGEELGRWMPLTVLDPRFDIERPAGRDLSDFG
jgi:hypothetical protein